LNDSSVYLLRGDNMNIIDRPLKGGSKSKRRSTNKEI
jgi:hypothetical protein